jgi:hypothetical protein
MQLNRGNTLAIGLVPFPSDYLKRVSIEIKPYPFIHLPHGVSIQFTILIKSHRSVPTRGDK